MAGQKPSGRGPRQGQVTRTSPTARPATAPERQAAGKQPRQAAARAATAAGSGKNGNGAGSAKSRPAAAAAGAASGAKKAASPAPAAAEPSGGPLRRLGRAAWSPFRQMGGLPLATFILSLYGLGASIYLTIAHYDTQITLACSDKGLINCEEVTTSAQSMVFGVLPVAVLGLAFYVFMVAVNSPWAWRLSWPPVRWARLGSVIVGMGFVLYLIYAELDQIHAICLWCTSVHVATFLIFTLLVFQAAFSWNRTDAPRRT